MMRTRDLLVILTASLALVLTTACDDDSGSKDDGTAGTAGSGAAGAGGEATGGMGGEATGGMGGEATGGMGGEATGGMGGEAPGGMGGTPPEQCADPEANTAALPESAHNGDFGPASRVTYLEIPTDPGLSEALGCGGVVGTNAGTGLAGLLGLAMINLEDLVNPDENGDIQVILLAEAADWAVGETGNDLNGGTGLSTLNMYIGAKDGENFLIDPASFGDDGTPLITFPETNMACGEVASPASDFGLTIPAEGLIIDLSLSATSVRGTLSVDGNNNGFELKAPVRDENGDVVEAGAVLTGYLTRGAVVELVDKLKMICAAEDAPGFCAQANQILAGDDIEALVDDVVIPILRGLDAKVDGDSVSECTDDCNAISVCLSIGSTGTNISGIAPEMME